MAISNNFQIFSNVLKPFSDDLNILGEPINSNLTKDERNTYIKFTTELAKLLKNDGESKKNRTSVKPKNISVKALITPFLTQDAIPDEIENQLMNLSLADLKKALKKKDIFFGEDKDSEINTYLEPFIELCTKGRADAQEIAEKDSLKKNSTPLSLSYNLSADIAISSGEARLSDNELTSLYVYNQADKMYKFNDKATNLIIENETLRSISDTIFSNEKDNIIDFVKLNCELNGADSSWKEGKSKEKITDEENTKKESLKIFKEGLFPNNDNAIIAKQKFLSKVVDQVSKTLKDTKKNYTLPRPTASNQSGETIDIEKRVLLTDKYNNIYISTPRNPEELAVLNPFHFRDLQTCLYGNKEPEPLSFYDSTLEVNDDQVDPVNKASVKNYFETYTGMRIIDNNDNFNTKHTETSKRGVYGILVKPDISGIDQLVNILYQQTKTSYAALTETEDIAHISALKAAQYQLMYLPGLDVQTRHHAVAALNMQVNMAIANLPTEIASKSRTTEYIQQATSFRLTRALEASNIDARILPKVMAQNGFILERDGKNEYDLESLLGMRIESVILSDQKTKVIDLLKDELLQNGKLSLETSAALKLNNFTFSKGQYSVYIAFGEQKEFSDKYSLIKDKPAPNDPQLIKKYRKISANALASLNKRIEPGTYSIEALAFVKWCVDTKILLPDEKQQAQLDRLLGNEPELRNLPASLIAGSASPASEVPGPTAPDGNARASQISGGADSGEEVGDVEPIAAQGAILKNKNQRLSRSEVQNSYDAAVNKLKIAVVKNSKDISEKTGFKAEDLKAQNEAAVKTFVKSLNKLLKEDELDYNRYANDVGKALSMTNLYKKSKNKITTEGGYSYSDDIEGLSNGLMTLGVLNENKVKLDKTESRAIATAMKRKKAGTQFSPAVKEFYDNRINSSNVERALNKAWEVSPEFKKSETMPITEKIVEDKEKLAAVELKKQSDVAVTEQTLKPKIEKDNDSKKQPESLIIKENNLNPTMGLATEDEKDPEKKAADEMNHIANNEYNETQTTLPKDESSTDFITALLNQNNQSAQSHKPKHYNQPGL